MYDFAPYWGHREYDAHGIGQEPTHTEYVSNRYSILQELLPNLGDERGQAAAA